MTDATALEESGVELPLLSDPLFTGFGLLVVVLMLGMVALFGWLLVRNVRIIRRADRQLTSTDAGRPAGPRHLPGSVQAPSLEQRLLELDDLHRRGVISDAEHAQARQQVLTRG